MAEKVLTLDDVNKKIKEKNLTIPFSSLIGDTVKIPVLIETKTISDGNNDITFSNLNGDDDLEYLIEFDCKVDLPSAGYLYIKPNNQTSTFYSYVLHISRTTISGGGIGTSGFCLLYLPYADSGGPSPLRSECNIKAKTGITRHCKFHSTYDRYDNAGGYSNLGTITWSNTSSNITSLVITLTGTNNHFNSGTIKLYKLKEITL